MIFIKCILVTGGAGFIGSNFIKTILNKYKDYKVINIDKLTYAGNIENLISDKDNINYEFIKCDISNKNDVEKIFKNNDIRFIVNFAAESHVDRSIDNPDVFLTTNIIGTHVLLSLAKKYWKIYSDDKYSMEYKEGVKFIQVSTDEVYGTLNENSKFTEGMCLKPNSPYSASKASADMIVRAYYKTFGLPINITRCSNNYGPYQFPEKFIPLIINNCINNRKIPVYGDGLQIRDWIHVHDHCLAICKVLQKGLIGEIYNIGGNNEKTNLEIVKTIIKMTNKSDSLIKHVNDRLGHDRRYAIDNTKICSELYWQPEINFKEGIKETIQWYLDNIKWLENIVSGEYKNYYDRMYNLD